MSDTLRVDALDELAVVACRVALFGVVLRRAGGRLAEVEYAGPLLDLLLVVLRRKGGIGAAVPDLHLGSRSIVSGIHVQDDLFPLFDRRSRLATAARIVPLVHTARGADEAARRDATVERHGADKLRVRRSEDVGHHGA